MRKNKKIIIFSLGGSLVVPKGKIAVNFLKKFRNLILKLLKRGYHIVIIVGGGGTNRYYNKEAQKITLIDNKDLDWLGIASSKLNSELLRVIFSKQAYQKVIDNPNTKIKTNKKLIIASGWKPGCSTDKDAVLWAKNFGAKKIINLSDINYVYDKDPGKYKDAQPIKKIKWKEFLKIVGTKWSPRTSSPFGPPASKLAKDLGIEVIVINGKDIKNLENCINNKDFKGTLIY